MTHKKPSEESSAWEDIKFGIFGLLFWLAPLFFLILLLAALFG